MLLEPDHYKKLDAKEMNKYGGPFDAKVLKAVMTRVTDVAVLRLLERKPLESLTFRENVGADPGKHTDGHIIINTARRSDARVGVTHEQAKNDVEYYFLVLLHEIGHAVAGQLAGSQADPVTHANFMRVYARGGGVTPYALHGCGQGRSFWEYFAETFTAAVALPNLRAQDPAGFDHVAGLLNAVRLAPPQ